MRITAAKLQSHARSINPSNLATTERPSLRARTETLPNSWHTHLSLEDAC